MHRPTPHSPPKPKFSPGPESSSRQAQRPTEPKPRHGAIGPWGLGAIGHEQSEGGSVHTLRCLFPSNPRPSRIKGRRLHHFGKPPCVNLPLPFLLASVHPLPCPKSPLPPPPSLPCPSLYPLPRPLLVTPLPSLS
ncbi:hypothetical protein M758_12G189200 [Ceratodon purpureus]|nr:hypothetical protein M758_12G189200 [Ceratodon purpureus]